MCYVTRQVPHCSVAARGRQPIEAELEKLGGMYLTDWGTAVSYMTAGEIFKMAGAAGHRKMIEWQKQREAGEVLDPPGLRSAAEEDRINEQNTADDADGSDQ